MADGCCQACDNDEHDLCEVQGDDCRQPHAHCDPDVCFTCKLRYWRENGPNIVVPRGFHD